MGFDSSAFELSGAAAVLGAPDYELFMGSDAYTIAAALSAQKVELRLPGAAAAAFQASFSFRFSGRLPGPYGERGLLFVLGPTSHMKPINT